MIQVEKTTVFTFKFPVGNGYQFSIQAASPEEAMQRLSQDLSQVQICIEAEKQRIKTAVA